jgi:hypothetical protein
LKLNGDADAPWPAVSLQPTSAVVVETGPVRVRSKREICWNVTARQPGYHRLAFQVGEQLAREGAAVGDGFMRVSVRRPRWDWSDILLYPASSRSRPTPVGWIEIKYSAAFVVTSGTDWWVAYWFGVAMVGAFCFRRTLNVNV